MWLCACTCVEARRGHACPPPSLSILWRGVFPWSWGSCFLCKAWRQQVPLMPLSVPASHLSRPYFTILQKTQQTDLLWPIFSISITVWSLSMGFGLSFAKVYILAVQTPSSCSVPCFPILDNGSSLHPECYTITDQDMCSSLHRKGDKTGIFLL